MMELPCNIIFSLFFVQIKEEDLLHSTHVGEAIKILQEVGHNTYDPEAFLKVILPSQTA